MAHRKGKNFNCITITLIEKCLPVQGVSAQTVAFRQKVALATTSCL